MRLRYWVREGVRSAVLIFAIILIISLLISFEIMNSDYHGIISTTAALTLFFGTMVQSLASSFGLYTHHIPLSLSLGSTRKEAIIGTHCNRFAYIFFFLTVCGIIIAVGDPEKLFVLPNFIIFIFSISLCSSGISGAVISFITRIENNTVKSTVVAIYVTVGILFWMLFMLILFSGVLVGILDVGLLLTFSVICLAAYLLCSAVEAIMIKKITVR